MSISFDYNSHFEAKLKLYDSKTFKQDLSNFEKLIHDPAVGFFNLFSGHNIIFEVENMKKEFSHKKTLVHIGIGGSSLGAKVLVSSLKNSSTKQTFFLDNVDPVQVTSIFKKINLEETLFYVVSKSGNTIETLAHFSHLIYTLKKNQISEANFKDYILVGTSSKEGTLYKLAKQFQLNTFNLPDNIGGRYSVFTQSGLFSAAFNDIDINSVWSGAKNYRQKFLHNELSNPLFQSAFTFYQLFKMEKINQTVIMPYSYRLKDFSEWFVQLWAESLGKKFDRNKNIVHTGLTPIAARGVIDQHSQVQLFVEGPPDKCLIFISCQNPNCDISFDEKIEASQINQLYKKTYFELLMAELKGTQKALTDAKRPYLHLQLDSISPQSIGELLITFQSLTVMMGQYLGVDPFDQPGVELGKKYSIELLSD